MMGTIVAATATQLGIAVEAALTVSDCLKLLRDVDRKPPVALIVDIFMPQEDAFDLMRALAAHKCQVPIVVMTGWGSEYLPVAREVGRVWGLDVIETFPTPLDHIRLP